MNNNSNDNRTNTETERVTYDSIVALEAMEGLLKIKESGSREFPTSNTTTVGNANASSPHSAYDRLSYVAQQGVESSSIPSRTNFHHLGGTRTTFPSSSSMANNPSIHSINSSIAASNHSSIRPQSHHQHQQQQQQILDTNGNNTTCTNGNNTTCAGEGSSMTYSWPPHRHNAHMASTAAVNNIHANPSHASATQHQQLLNQLNMTQAQASAAVAAAAVGTSILPLLAQATQVTQVTQTPQQSQPSSTSSNLTNHHNNMDASSLPSLQALSALHNHLTAGASSGASYPSSNVTSSASSPVPIHTHTPPPHLPSTSSQQQQQRHASCPNLTQLAHSLSQAASAHSFSQAAATTAVSPSHQINNVTMQDTRPKPSARSPVPVHPLAPHPQHNMQHNMGVQVHQSNQSRSPTLSNLSTTSINTTASPNSINSALTTTPTTTKTASAAKKAKRPTPIAPKDSTSSSSATATTTTTTTTTTRNNEMDTSQMVIRTEEIKRALKSKPQRGRKRDNLNGLERMELTRSRNREHAKCTRIRKKRRNEELLLHEKYYFLMKDQQDKKSRQIDSTVSFLQVRTELLQSSMTSMKENTWKFSIGSISDVAPSETGMDTSSAATTTTTGAPVVDMTSNALNMDEDGGAPIGEPIGEDSCSTPTKSDLEILKAYKDVIEDPSRADHNNFASTTTASTSTTLLTQVLNAPVRSMRRASSIKSIGTTTSAIATNSGSAPSTPPTPPATSSITSNPLISPNEGIKEVQTHDVEMLKAVHAKVGNKPFKLRFDIVGGRDGVAVSNDGSGFVEFELILEYSKEVLESLQAQYLCSGGTDVSSSSPLGVSTVTSPLTSSSMTNLSAAVTSANEGTNLGVQNTRMIQRDTTNTNTKKVEEVLLSGFLKIRYGPSCKIASVKQFITSNNLTVLGVLKTSSTVSGGTIQPGIRSSLGHHDIFPSVVSLDQHHLSRTQSEVAIETTHEEKVGMRS